MFVKTFLCTSIVVAGAVPRLRRGSPVRERPLGARSEQDPREHPAIHALRGGPHLTVPRRGRGRSDRARRFSSTEARVLFLLRRRRVR